MPTRSTAPIAWDAAIESLRAQLADPSVLTTVDVIRARHDDDLRTAIAWAIPRITGLPEPAVPDADGDFVLWHEDTPVVVQTDAAERLITVYACIAMEADVTSTLLDVFDGFNDKVPFVKMHTTNLRVYVTTTIYADPFVPRHLEEAITRLGKLLPWTVRLIDAAQKMDTEKRKALSRRAR